MVSECLSRLWWFAEHTDTPYKIVFLDIPRNNGFQLYNVLEAMGLDRDRIEVIAEPTRFDRIIVPEQAWIMYSEYRPQMVEVFDLFKSRVTPGPYKKLYLSRTNYKGKAEINEVYYEDFYRRRGYTVIHLEEMPFPEQVSVISGADEVVCLQSSQQHMLAFCRNGARAVVLTRLETPNIPFTIAAQLRGLEVWYIHANYNFLPVKLWNSTAYLYGPTEFWRQYLDAEGIAYEEDELSFDRYVRPYIYDYLMSWRQRVCEEGAYRSVHNFGLIDVVDGLNKMFFHTPIDRVKFPDRDDVTRLKTANREQRAQIKDLQDKLGAMESDMSLVREQCREVRANNQDLREHLREVRENYQQLKTEFENLK